jgi:hypothetical protein
VNEVMEVLRIQESDIKSPPRLMTKIHEDYVHGVITHDGRLIILLDIQQVISEEELIKLADMSRSQQRKYGQIDLEDDDEKIIEERKIDLIAEKAKLAGDKKRKHRR